MGPHQLALFRGFVTEAKNVFGSALSITTYRDICRAKKLEKAEGNQPARLVAQRPATGSEAAGPKDVVDLRQKAQTD